MADVHLEVISVLNQFCMKQAIVIHCVQEILKQVPTYKSVNCLTIHNAVACRCDNMHKINSEC